MCKCAADSGALPFVEAAHEWVIVNFDALEIQQPQFPVECLLLVGSESDSFGGGNCSSQEVTPETILGGSGEMAKVSGSCSGTCKERSAVSFSSDRWKSRDKQSAMSFTMPAIQVLWATHSLLSRSNAKARATFICSGVVSLKLDLCIHPAADELSVWLRRTDCGGTPSSSKASAIQM
jgi:hypothetical protein